MIAQDIMISPVYKVKQDDTVRSVIERFIKYRISGLPVVNDHNEVVAYISDGDIMRYIGKHERRVIDFFFYMLVIQGDDDLFEERVKRLLDINVMKIAKLKVFTVAWDDEVEDIAALLGKKQIKKLPVVRGGVLIGIISRGDVIRHAFKAIL